MTARNESEHYQLPSQHEHLNNQQLQHLHLEHHENYQAHHHHQLHQHQHHQQLVPMQHVQQHSEPPAQLYQHHQLQQPAADLENVASSAPLGCEEILLPSAAEQTHYVPETDPMSVCIFEDITSIVGTTDGSSVDHTQTTAETAQSMEVPTLSSPQDPINAQQLPKKRKNAIHDTLNSDLQKALSNPIETTTENGQSFDAYTEAQEDELPTSSARVSDTKENTVDIEQCRVCTEKEDLVSLFKMIDNQTVANMIMTICPTVSIAMQDFMPQYICNACVDKVSIAIQLKQQCEKTETELRKKLSRGKNKVRRPTGYIVIDAHVESDPPTDDDDEPNDDEFKVSASEQSSSSSSSYEDESDYGYKKKTSKRTAGTAAKRGRRSKKFINNTPQAVKEKKRPGRPPLNRSAPNVYTTPTANNSGEEEEICINANGQIKRIRRIDLEYEQRLHEQQQQQQRQQQKQQQQQHEQQFPCDECPQVFTRKLSLQLHKKAHQVRDPIRCEVCGKQFRVKGAYKTHLEKHSKDYNGFKCEKCGRIMSSRADLKRHMADEHGEAGLIYVCNRCGRNFVTQTRLQKHQINRCPGYADAKQRRCDLAGYSIGKNLFRTVAPVTTTYWSDSFSE